MLYNFKKSKNRIKFNYSMSTFPCQLSRNKSIDQGFNNILVVFGNQFNGFKLVKEFLIGEGIIGQVIGAIYIIGKLQRKLFNIRGNMPV